MVLIINKGAKVNGCTLDKYFSIEPEKKKYISNIAIK